MAYENKRVAKEVETSMWMHPEYVLMSLEFILLVVDYQCYSIIIDKNYV